jgi:hypothetical protein
MIAVDLILKLFASNPQESVHISSSDWSQTSDNGRREKGKEHKGMKRFLINIEG